MAGLIRTERTRVRRRPERASYERAVVHAILDEALVCHVGFVHDAQPFVLPTTHARVRDRLYLHGAAASRMLRGLREGIPVCVTVTLLDGLVLARAAMHHSMNYRSVVVLGAASEVTDEAERLAALEAIVEHVLPGRWREVRPPSPQELRATMVLRVPIREASAKIRTGGPLDGPEDLAWPCWAGHVPLELVAGAPVPDGAVAASAPRVPPRSGAR
jgi:nitroimidazol reductase NimA-like FMN-containing flavoprotein (pyridoxamine 5'-phosphate oxidase superfamily)